MNAQVDSFETTAEFIELYYRPIDPHRAICSFLHDDGFRSIYEIWLARRLRQACLKPPLLVGNNHKNRQQHQQNIDQRNHICVGEDSALPPTTPMPRRHLARIRAPGEEDSHILRDS